MLPHVTTIPSWTVDKWLFNWLGGVWNHPVSLVRRQWEAGVIVCWSRGVTGFDKCTAKRAPPNGSELHYQRSPRLRFEGEWWSGEPTGRCIKLGTGHGCHNSDQTRWHWDKLKNNPIGVRVIVKLVYMGVGRVLSDLSIKFAVKITRNNETAFNFQFGLIR